MLDFIKSLFSKGDSDLSTHLPKDESATFILKVDNINVGELSCSNGEWRFEYFREFKEAKDYNPIVGFPDVDKVYHSSVLWPFFRIRIPGLKQSSVKEILERENIDATNEVALLKRFGWKTIANPYILIEKASPQISRHTNSAAVD